MGPATDLRFPLGYGAACGMRGIREVCCGSRSPSLISIGTHGVLPRHAIRRVKTLRFPVLALGLNGDSVSANKNNGFSKTWHPKIDP